MQLFHCTHCQNAVYFENHQCVKCGHRLAYLPDQRQMASLDPAGEAWTTPAAPDRQYRLCANYLANQVCNWVMPPESPHALCESCRFTRVIPDLSLPEWHAAWYKLELAKRHLLYEIGSLGLTVTAKADDEAHGLAFEFLADSPKPEATPVVTGHAAGVITIALAEADDAERERRRLELREPYRTLLGHFRHEVGHYFWDRLISDVGHEEEFRAVFGDERADYAAALQRHYAEGAPENWAGKFISAYASAHPWEDWAETWAHYLHMRDALETAEANELKVGAAADDPPVSSHDFDAMLPRWHALTHTLNSMNRSLGLNDAYPFVLSPPTVAKMRFVHDIVTTAKAPAIAVTG